MEMVLSEVLRNFLELLCSGLLGTVSDMSVNTSSETSATAGGGDGGATEVEELAGTGLAGAGLAGAVLAGAEEAGAEEADEGLAAVVCAADLLFACIRI